MDTVYLSPPVIHLASCQLSALYKMNSENDQRYFARLELAVKSTNVPGFYLQLSFPLLHHFCFQSCSLCLPPRLLPLHFCQRIFGMSAKFWFGLEQQNIKELLSPGCLHHRETTSHREKLVQWFWRDWKRLFKAAFSMRGRAAVWVCHQTYLLISLPLWQIRKYF